MVEVLASATLHGVEAYRVDVEVDIAGGLPQYIVVGLPAPAVREGGSRIRAALGACGQEVPARKITVNLAPADRRKDGASFDLPIALCLLGASGAFDLSTIRDLLVAGELGLDGTIRPVRGILAMASVAKAAGLRGVLVPSANAAEARAVEDLQVFAADHLSQILNALRGEGALDQAVPGRIELVPRQVSLDFAEVRGQPAARRALEIAVAGGHNLLMIGPPGIGKTMLARRVPGILPALARSEAIEVTRIYSAAGLLAGGGLVQDRPFRAPHHTVSSAALVGGGSFPRPGEVTLAHRGVLFLDELAEFPRHVIDCLRQPLEDRCITIGRAQGTVLLPAAFHLVAASNPCPCGWRGSDERECKCSEILVERYRQRLSGPLLDRIDLQVKVGVVSLAELRHGGGGESSQAIRERVCAARERMRQRLAPYNAHYNAEMEVKVARATCPLEAKAEDTLAQLVGKKQGITARTIDRLVRVARTIADLEGVEVITAQHILEATIMRVFDTDVTRAVELGPRRSERARAS